MALQVYLHCIWHLKVWCLTGTINAEIYSERLIDEFVIRITVIILRDKVYL